MFASKTLLACCALALALTHTYAAKAADHDYFVHYGDTDWNQSGDITSDDQYDLPMTPKNGACGMRFTGAEHYQWVNEYGMHLGTEATGGDAIQVRLQDRPGCSGSGIEITVGNDVVNLPNYDIESFFVYQASSAKWTDNNDNVIAPPPCGQACVGPSNFKTLQRAPEWSSAIFALANVNPAIQRNGAAVLDLDERVRNLLNLEVPALVARLGEATRKTVQARRGTLLRSDDPFTHDREDTALAALGGAASAAQQCVAAWTQGSTSGAELACEKAARLLRRAQGAVETLAETLAD